MYKQWLVLTYLENPADFPQASDCLELSVTNHATAHTRNVVRKLKKPMDKAISEIIERLKKYPNTDYELEENSIIVKKNNDNGFSVSLTSNGNGNYTVAFDIWHEEFDNEIDALNCFAFGLSKDCRLKTTLKNDKPIKWTVQSNENENWVDGSTTGLINLAFWKKSKVVYLQNDLIK